MPTLTLKIDPTLCIAAANCVGTAPHLFQINEDGLAEAVAMERQEGERGSTYSFQDPVLEKKVLIEYVGDAKFKGVVRSIPVYRIVAV